MLLKYWKDCEVVILPTRLCRKRYWSKKYPICLKGVKLLGTKGGITTTASSSSLQQTEAQPNTSTATASNNSSNLLREESTTSSSELDMNTLVLFGRTDREKEEWFNLFCKVCLIRYFNWIFLFFSQSLWYFRLSIKNRYLFLAKNNANHS